METEISVKFSPVIDAEIQFCFDSVNGSCVRTIFPTALRGFLYLLFGSMSVLTVWGNLTVIIVILHFKQLHTPTNCLIISLALADLLLGALVMPPSMMQSVERCWFLGDFLCKIHISADVVLCTASILHLSCISIDRYYAICHPLQYRSKITVRTAFVMTQVSWTICAIVACGSVTLLVSNSGAEEVNYNHMSCKGVCFLFYAGPSSTLGVIISFYLPAIIMLSIYLKILLVAQTHARSIQSTACRSRTPGAFVSKKERKAMKTLAIVMGCFLICWAPTLLTVVIDPYINYSIPHKLLEALLWISYFSSSLNPFIYAFFYSWFRRGFRIIISGKIFFQDSSETQLIFD